MRFSEFRNINETFTNLGDVAKALSFISDPFGGATNSEVTSNDTPTGSEPQRGKDIPIVGATDSINWRDVSSYISDKMDNSHRLGLLANIQGESAFRPGVLGDNNTSGGLFQHHLDRFAKLRKELGTNWAREWKRQVDYALAEPEGQKYLKTSFKSPAEAVAWWVTHFERPKYPAADIKNRINLLSMFA